MITEDRLGKCLIRGVIYGGILWIRGVGLGIIWIPGIRGVGCVNQLTHEVGCGSLYENLCGNHLIREVDQGSLSIHEVEEDLRETLETSVHIVNANLCGHHTTREDHLYPMKRMIDRCGCQSQLLENQLRDMNASLCRHNPIWSRHLNSPVGAEMVATEGLITKRKRSADIADIRLRVKSNAYLQLAHAVHRLSVVASVLGLRDHHRDLCHAIVEMSLRQHHRHRLLIASPQKAEVVAMTSSRRTRLPPERQ